MSYSEEQDFAEKEAALATMLRCIEGKCNQLQDLRALEIGGSGGILAGLVSQYVDHVISTDIDDTLAKYEGQFSYLLKQKFQRNGRNFDVGKVEFLWADAQDIPFKDNLFSLVFSHNVFEHIPDPLTALREIIRVTALGGIVYLSFDPVWTADSGSHFFHYIRVPWQHLISSDAEIAALMKTNGASDEEILSYKQDMNRHPAAYYRDNIPRIAAEMGTEILYHSSYSGCTNDTYVNHPNREVAAWRLNCEPDDLLIRNFQFLIRKPA